MSTVDELVAERHHLAARIDRSEDERPDLCLLTHRVQVAARASTEADQRRLHEALGVLEGSVHRALDRLGERLKAVGAHRHALAAYGSLRPFTNGQHVRSRA